MVRLPGTWASPSHSHPVHPTSGSMGVQLMSRDFEAIGAEAFVPPSETRERAAFLFGEATHGQWTFQAGTRYEHQDVSAEDDRTPACHAEGRGFEPRRLPPTESDRPTIS